MKKRTSAKATGQDIPDEYMLKKCRVIGENIRYERKIRYFSIEDLAEYLELSPSYVGLLERGERCPSLKSLLKVCDLFGSTPDKFILEKPGKTVLSEEHAKEPKDNQLKTIKSLSLKMDKAELDFVISVMKGVKTMRKKEEDNIK